MIAFLFVFLTAHPALAAPLSVPFKAWILKKKQDMAIRASAPPRHHFNLKAPKSVMIAGDKTDFVFEKISGTEVIFKLKRHDLQPSDKASVSLYLCDDANTYCIKQEERVLMEAGD